MKNISKFIILALYTTVMLVSNCSNDKNDSTVRAENFWIGDTTQILGIDISHHQGAIDWKLVKNHGLCFVFVKATEGIDYLDSMFTTYWKELEHEHIIRGAYHFYSSDDDPLEQAQWFVGNVKSFNNALPPVLDIERMGHKHINPATFERGVLKCLYEIERLSGKKPIIYSSPHFADKYLFDESFSDYLLWVAEYGVDQPELPNAWDSTGWHFWQHTSSDQIPGIEKEVDQNIFSKEIELLIALTRD